MSRYKEGDQVKLVNPDSIKKFGEGPFKILSLLPHINAVELDEIGSVDVSEIASADESYTAPPRMPGLQSFSQEPDSVTTSEAARRIESVAGTLLSHNDANVRLAMREILRLLWKGEDNGMGGS